MIVHNVEGLLPCPFCGSPAELVTNSSRDDFVRCTNKLCAARTRLHHENVNGPINQWNSRVRESCHVAVGDGQTRGWWVCSECGELFDMVGALAVKGTRKPSFCPNCGRQVMA